MTQVRLPDFRKLANSLIYRDNVGFHVYVKFSDADSDLRSAQRAAQNTAPLPQQISIGKNARQLPYQPMTGDMSAARIETMHHLKQINRTLLKALESQ